MWPVRRRCSPPAYLPAKKQPRQSNETGADYQLNNRPPEHQSSRPVWRRAADGRYGREVIDFAGRTPEELP